ncbi:hypothetical protein [Paenibacillus sediminis]|uniref:DUF4025 domain-containing protein n=1 Tax=Paenibacillus sediminis TaxID=664909 RepID=A0ABS4H5Q5_9BACL|nr:hypothetical protein [Paenibacillus sediminis]MBP1937863.1 hypothetical protein [Paenibacillus sediminis]
MAAFALLLQSIKMSDSYAIAVEQKLGNHADTPSSSQTNADDEVIDEFFSNDNPSGYDSDVNGYDSERHHGRSSSHTRTGAS